MYSENQLNAFAPSEDTFPESGPKAWSVVFASWCIILSVYGPINSAGVFEAYFSQHQLKDFDASTRGWIFSVNLFLVFFAGMQVGPTFDRYGPRWLAVIGSILIVTSQMLLGLCTEYYQIMLTYAVLGGIGGALLNAPAFGAIAHFFEARRGVATGIATMAGSVGGIAFPLLMQHLLPRVGFAWTTRTIGLVLLVFVITGNCLIDTRLPLSSRLVSVLPDASIFRDPKFTLSCAGIWFMEWGILIPLTFIVSYAADYSHPANSSYTLLVLLNVGSFFGRFVTGFFADWMGRFNAIVVTNGLCVIAILVFWLPARNSWALLLVFALTFGFTSGGNLSLYPVCLGQLCDPRSYGRFFSTALMVSSFASLTSLPIGGALRDVGTTDEGWNAVIIFSALSYAAAMSCFFGAKVLAVGWGLQEVF
ncbi:major facilitator superfamily domain-containing protein [Apiospora arundinis]|uniref:Major facilitator superfamily domain-containing protein n=1 Tax=Apiospora arundinis TaxID=335852 RepID=A0ABR2I914_9PEZI